ncbi:unnamed protein product [Heligmosomoides polygyrus]|uniref:DUF1758 domain-containing protein n=1 Tax=Heligmosomoides polygyrus TaxID=6339 RepID=A0A183F8A3_HELPZ|nr:unnamed protein product [Heligmosomoides polygyrus]
MAYSYQSRTYESVSVLLDTGSQPSFITGAAVKRLGLSIEEYRDITLVTLGGHPVAERFGPIISGMEFNVTLQTIQEDDNSKSDNLEDDDAKNLASKLWKLEVVGITDDPDPLFDSQENDRVVKEFFETATEIDGFLHVKFPWKMNHPPLADNKQLAYERLQNQLKDLNSRPEILNAYSNVFESQLSSGVIEEVEEASPNSSLCYYLPHQAVIKESSTSPIRVAFDASSHYKGSPSLNICLHQGPTILPSLIEILLRMRTYRFLLISDVEKAFHQIRLLKNQRDVTRFFWIKDITKPPSSDNLRHFRFRNQCFAFPFGNIDFILSQKGTK